MWAKKKRRVRDEREKSWEEVVLYIPTPSGRMTLNKNCSLGKAGQNLRRGLMPFVNQLSD